jgi:transposase-like protein
MELLGKIKRLYFRDKKSLHEIAKYTGLSRNTIRKWVREPKAEDALKYVRQDMPAKLAPYQAEIEQALKADSHRIKQNRRTAKALLIWLGFALRGCVCRCRPVPGPSLWGKVFLLVPFQSLLKITKLQ